MCILTRRRLMNARLPQRLIIITRGSTKASWWWGVVFLVVGFFLTYSQRGGPSQGVGVSLLKILAVGTAVHFLPLPPCLEHRAALQNQATRLPGDVLLR